MARYLAENEIPAGCAGHAFVGWDKLDGKAEEASEEKDLGMKMPAVFSEVFRSLAPGQRIKLPSGRSLFREY